MPPARVIPDPTELRRLLRTGHTHQQIADLVFERTGRRVTREAISTAVSRAGLSAPMNRYSTHLPWKVKIEHSKHYAARMLRLMGRKSEGGKLTEEDEARLQSWLEKLRETNSVVAYLPETEDGFYYVAPPRGYRRQADGPPIITKPLRLDDIRTGRVRW